MLNSLHSDNRDAPRRTPSVLLVDDEQPMLRTLRRMIQPEGYDVRDACDAATFSTALAEQPEVILLDLQLGDLSGVELMREVRAASPDSEVIMMTGYATIDSVVASMRAGAFDYLDSLEGMVPYVSCRVMLLCFNAHRMPVDEQLRTALIEHGAASGSMDVPGVSAWLGRQIKAAKGVETHFALQSWIDEGATRIELGTGASSGLSSASNASKTAGRKGASERAGAGTINKAAR
ncbi:MAG: response regulator [Myxococcales bacterium]|nr:response regulator [Myxococcales bacterium]